MSNRRSFVSRLFSLLPATVAGALAVPRTLSAQAPEPVWLSEIRKARHPLFLDVPSFRPDGTALRRAAAYLNAHEGAGSVAIGFHSDGLAYVLGDTLWRELELAARFSLPPNPAQPGNPFTRIAMGSTPALQDLHARGVRLLACRNTMRRWSESYADRLKLTAADVFARMEQGLVAGAEVVPAMIVAAATAQEARVPYVISP